MATSMNEKAFYENSGMKKICKSLHRELAENGRLEERGNDDIDQLIRAINKLAEAARQSAISEELN